MKKLGKKFSFLTKVMLVIGLLVSNLSSLTFVFAYEATESVEITLTDDNLEIKYTEELTDVEGVKVKVFENYTYLDNSSEFEDAIMNEYSLSTEDFLSTGVSKVSILAGTDPATEENIETFDGLYEVKVEITDLEGKEIGSAIYSKNVEHEKGLEIKLYDSSDNEIVASENGVFSISREKPQVKALARVLSGGLVPNTLYKYDDQEYFALELVKDLVFDFNYDMTGLLYGDYTTILAVNLLQKVEEVEVGAPEKFEDVVFADDLKFEYEDSSLNGEVLNSVAASLGLDKFYHFSNDSKNGTIYTLLDLSDEAKERTMLDLYKIVNSAVDGIDTLSYVLSNSSNEDIIKSYEELVMPSDKTTDDAVQLAAETEEVSLEEYLSEIKLDDTAKLKLIGEGITDEDEGITVTYDVVVLGDINKDNKLDEEDLTKLIEEVVTGNVSDKLKSDITSDDGEVNTLDVMQLKEIIKTKDWYSSLEDAIQGKLLANLEVSEEEITSGDTFTVSYVLSLTDYDVNGLAGKLKYNKDVFELVSVEVDQDWLGSNKDGKFLYLTDEVLTAPEITETEGEEQTPSPEQNGDSNQAISVITEGDVNAEEDTTPIVTEDYTILTATFKALKASSLEDGNVITLDNVELFNDNVYIELDTTKVESEVIVVNADTNNRLASLKVAGQEIELLENVFEYEIVVKNEVTVADVEYVLESATANITSIVIPEELVEGENKIIITVVSESGLEQVYTIVVNREAAPKKEVVVNTNNYYGDYDNDQEEEVIVTPGATQEEEKTEEKNGTLSRVIIIILILLVISGLIYLIFKDDDETKKANKQINKLKKEENEPVVKTTENTNNKKVNKSSKNKGSKNNKRER